MAEGHVRLDLRRDESHENATLSSFNSTWAGIPNGDDHMRQIQNVDWASTSMGAMEAWPQELSLIVTFILLDPEPRLLLLGPEDRMLYNPAYAAMIGEFHPAFMGIPARDGWVDETHTSIIDETHSSIENTGKPYVQHDVPFYIMRHGCIEEKLLSWRTTPLIGAIPGYYVALVDRTDLRVAERRRATLQSLSTLWDTARDVGSLWQMVVQSISNRHHDFPFALLYATDTGIELEESYTTSTEVDQTPVFHLQGSVGDFGQSISATLDLTSGDKPLSQLLRKATSSEQPLVLRVEDQLFPGAWNHAASRRGHGDPLKAAVAVSVRSSRYQNVRGLLIMGLNTRRPYDESYQAWILELNNLLRDKLTSIVLYEEEAKNKAEGDRRFQARQALLFKELSVREREAWLATGQVQRMLKVMEMADVGIWECGLNGELTLANEAWYHQSGHPRGADGAEKFSWLDRVHDEDREIAVNGWKRLIALEPISYEMRWKGANIDDPAAEENWILAVCVPVTDDKGELISISGCTTNIAAQKRSERDAVRRAEALERARSSETQFLRFTEIAPIGIAVSELSSGQITFANDKWFELFGMPREDLNKVPWLSFLHIDDVAHVETSIASIERQHSSGNFQFRVKRMCETGDGQGGNAWLNEYAAVILDAEKNPKALATCLTDISQLKFAESAQRLRVEEAIEAKRQQENFIDMTSHEIRNPLGAVVLCADSISDALTEMTATLQKLGLAPESDNGRKMMGLIENSVDAVSTIASCSVHQRRIVDDLLTLSKLDSKLLHIQVSPVQVVELLRGIEKMFEAEAGQAGVAFNAYADPSLEELRVKWAMIDLGRVKQVIINLLTNAIKFTKNEQVRKVTLRMGATKRRPVDADLSVHFVLAHTVSDAIYEPMAPDDDDVFIWFVVEDTGRGMSKEETARLFTWFTQASPRTYSEYGGSGLGLCISKQLVELQGGEIGVASEAGVGSTFSFFIRTRTVAAPLTVPISDLANRRRSVVLVEKDGKRRSVSVLLCEDNLVNQRVVKKQLVQHGYEVHAVENGQEALDYLKTTSHWRDMSPSKDSVDVILMDVEMPIMDGLTCARKIREHEKHGDILDRIPIIAVSANARTEQISQAVAAGMDDALAKPFRITDLMPKIDRWADRARAPHV